MKVLSAEQLRQADAFTITHTPISSINLMERAATLWAVQFMEDFPDTGNRVYILCGPGNNGGDGLVIARCLVEHAYEVEVWIPEISPHKSDDFAYNFDRLPLRQGIIVRKFDKAEDIPHLTESHYVIDALFGSGLSRPISGIGAALIENINKHSSCTLSVDMPSGLYADKIPDGPVIKAHTTYSFQSPKLTMLLDAFHEFTGIWKILDIGLDKDFIDRLPTDYFMLDIDLVKVLQYKRPKTGHKGLFGHAHLAAGSYGKSGAAILFSKACLRAGAGLVTAHVPRCGVIPLQVAVPELMLLPDHHEYCITILDRFPEILALGPGMGTNKLTAQALCDFLKKASHPLVLDADALNIISMNKASLEDIPERSILTPHPKEFERLFGRNSDPIRTLKHQMEISVQYGIYIVFKSHFSRVSTPEGLVYFNSTGNDGMATAGSGDVLSGIISGLLVQGYPPLAAAITGMYIHGLAGDIAADRLGHNALIAGDIIDHLGIAFKVLEL